MSAVDALLDGVRRLFLDTAPVIYYVENNPVYARKIEAVFSYVDAKNIAVATSAVTLAECLIHPYRLQNWEGITVFQEFIVRSEIVEFVVIDDAVANQAASLRVKYGFTLPDAFQVAAALAAR